MLRIGIAGPGTIWEKVHQPIIQRHGVWRITGFCVHREEKKAYWQNRFPDALVTADLGEFLASPQIDAVVVTTPLQLNASVTLRALKAGKHVFVEKPLATSGEEVRAVIEAQKSGGKSVFVLEQQLYSPRIPVLRELIASKRLGEMVTFENLSFYLMDERVKSEIGYEQAPWRLHADFPLGHIWDGGVHQISVFNALFGLPRSIFAKGSSLREGMGEYNHILMLLDYGAGFRACYSQSAFLGGSGARFDLYFTEGALYVKKEGLILENKRTRERETVAVPEGDLYEAMWTKLERLMDEGGTPPFTLQDAMDCVAFLKAVQRSIETGGDARV